MQPVAYFCTCVNGPVPLDHWTGLKCPKPPMPLGWLISICNDKTGDTDHADGKITTTRLFGCPRDILISDFVKPRPDEPTFGLVFDPRRMNSAHFGTVVHREIEKHTPGGGYHEIKFPLEGQAPPVLDFGDGVSCSLSGRVDYIEPDIAVIEDYKTHSETAHKFKWNKKGAEAEVRAQVGVYKALIQLGIVDVHVNKARIWHGAMTSAKHPAPPWFDVDVEPMTLYEVGSLRPFGSKHTVRDVIKMYQWALEQITAIKEPRDSQAWYMDFFKIVNALPMVGETQFGGDKCLTYCGAAQPICFQIAGKPTVL